MISVNELHMLKRSQVNILSDT